MEEHQLIFITGGVRSGKSSFAEKIAHQQQQSYQTDVIHYIACGKATDEEMIHRIARHKRDRERQQIEWVTHEQSSDLHLLADRVPTGSICLLDCVTTLLSNELYDRQVVAHMVVHHILNGIDCIREKCHSFVVVSNEVNGGMPFASEMVTSYQQKLGMIHLELVKRSNQAILVEYGIPIYKKSGG